MSKQFLDLNGLEVYHTNMSSYVDSRAVELTQDEYDDLVDEGGVDPDVTYYISDGVAPGSPVTDVKMNNVSIVSNHVANIPLVSSSTNGLVPQGTSVTTQSQSTKFLREDGSWQAPSYTSVSDRALIDGSNIASPATFRQNIGLNIHTETYTGTTNSQSLLTTNIPWTGNILAAYATVVSTSVRVFAIGHRPSGGGYIVSKLATDSGGAVAEQSVTLTITLIG